MNIIQTGQNQQKPKVAVVLEWDNAQEMQEQHSVQLMASLLNRIQNSIDQCQLPLEMIIVFDPHEVQYQAVAALLQPLWGKRKEWLKVTYIQAPYAAYYEKKSVAAFLTEADILVYADSDCTYAEDWFAQLLKPFEDDEVMISCGRTYAMLGSFVENVSALCWFFPLDHKKDPQQMKPRFWGNNFAVRTAVMREYPFVRNTDARIWGGEFIKTLKAHNVKIAHPPALGKHKQLYNLHYMFRRSITLGQHSDAWVMFFKNSNRLYRAKRGIMNLFKSQIKFARRYSQLWQVAYIQPWLMIPGYLLGMLFTLSASVSQIVSALKGDHAPVSHDYRPLLEVTEVLPG